MCRFFFSTNAKFYLTGHFRLCKVYVKTPVYLFLVIVTWLPVYFIPVLVMYSGSVGVKLCNACDASSRTLLSRKKNAVLSKVTLTQWVRNIPGEIKPFIYIHYLLRVYFELIMWPAPRWLDSSVGRALHRYRRGMGTNPVQAWIFFML